MIIVGELINSSRKVIAEAIIAQDAETIKQIASDQIDAGADYIDVNAGIFVDEEIQYLSWLTKTVQSTDDVPCALDSPDPKALEAALKVHKGTAMINSISLEKERFDTLLPLIAGSDIKVVALCMSDEGMPKTVDDRMRIADKLVNGLTAKNIALENIYMDPLVQPLSVDGTFGMEFINSIEKIVTTWPGIHTMCGLSNISYGLPGRKFLNRTFMVMAITKGLDGAIMNPLDRKMRASIIAAEALAGRDSYCMKFLKAFRAGELE
jgi:5-methyltetrahydrofolate corrinoid/iron sulfur protein methyltransferase